MNNADERRSPLVGTFILGTLWGGWPAMFPALDAFRNSLHAQLIASVVAAVVLVVITRGRFGYRSGGAILCR
ncbi:hypothetical protein [Fodinicola feengrottensis]|uniref:hypothetical protein n=1 Tax=Fodinicola feengrottensis TaxID=435914 RepID=UPI002442EF44|nr:hypothetical protein [Fodinicola feengrottensis]